MKIGYWITTGLLSAMMLLSAGMYFFNTAEIETVFRATGFPTWVIYPLGTLKVLAVIALLSNASRWLKEWAYSGLLFNFLLALGAHQSISDGDQIGAIIAVVLLLASYFFYGKVYGNLLMPKPDA